MKIKNNTLAEMYRLAKELWHQHRLALSGYIVAQVLWVYFALLLVANTFNHPDFKLFILVFVPMIYIMGLMLGGSALLKQRTSLMRALRRVMLKCTRVFLLPVASMMCFGIFFSTDFLMWFTSADPAPFQQGLVLLLVVFTPSLTQWGMSHLLGVYGVRHLVLPDKVIGRLIVAVGAGLTFPYYLGLYNHLVFISLNTFFAPLMFTLIYLYNLGHRSQWDIERKKREDEALLEKGYLPVPDFLRKK